MDVSWKKSSWPIIVLVAAAVQIFFIYRSSDHLLDPDAVSAISRAKTQTCKKELKEFVDRITSQGDNQLQLRRSCKLDINRQRIQRAGCASNQTQELVKLDGQVANSSVCLDICFSYGHSHGGYQLVSNSCFCGDSSRKEPQGENTGCHEVNEFEWFRVNSGIFNPTRASTHVSVASNVTKVKIAFLLSVRGRSIMQIERLLRNIFSDEHVYYIHVDQRDDYLFKQLLRIENNYDNVIVARSRFNTIWGGTSLLRMIFDAMEHLIGHSWDYLINLSETDFPIKPLRELEFHLAQSRKSIHLRSHNMKGYNFIKKQGLDRNFYQCEDRVWNMGKRHLPRGIVYSGGSDWFALPRDFCLYILDNLSNSRGLVKPLMQLYNYTLLPAESYFHTLALNSEFCDRYVDDNLRITNWRRKQGCKCQHKDVVDWCGCSPLTYRWSDWEKLRKTESSRNLFLSRKFDPTISMSIINAVERQLIDRNVLDDIAEYDTRYWQNVYSDEDCTRDPAEYCQVLQQFGLFALVQAKQLEYIKKPSMIRLDSIDMHFNHDRFVGLIYHYELDGISTRLLVERNIGAHLRNSDSSCENIGGRSLNVVEVNHGFDTGERLFRDYRPLNHLSDIVVYHEWFVRPTMDKHKNSTAKLQFLWINPKSRIEVAQSVTLKGARKPTRLSLAHRLNIRKPTESGLWTLSVLYQNNNCLDYNFLVFDTHSFARKKIGQDEFNKFYIVSKVCSNNTNRIIGDSVGNSCYYSDWSGLSTRVDSSKLGDD